MRPFLRSGFRRAQKTRKKKVMADDKAVNPAATPDDGVAEFEAMLARVREAQKKFSTYTQEQVDAIFKAAALAANKQRIPLAKQAVAETGMGIVEDKVIKNHYAAEYIYNTYKHTKTCGVVERDEAMGIEKWAEPIGVIGAVIPTTNPTSTAIFKTLLALKTRNGIIISPHPRAKQCTIAAAKVVLDAAVAAGAPAEIIGWIEQPSLPKTNLLMKEADIILATGGPGMVKAAYSSGTPAVGVGAGNAAAIIDPSADLINAVNSIIHSKTFDNGMICATEQTVIADKEIYDAVKDEFQKRGCYFLNEKEKDLIRKTMLINGALNAKIVGQRPVTIAKMAGFENSLDIAEQLLVNNGGLGHTSVLWIDELNEKAKLATFADRMKACRLIVNSPSSLGGIGDIYNFAMPPSLTLGCGSWGGNSVSENVGVKHLINIKTMAIRRENMLWFRAPEKVYQKKGCLAVALRELGEVMGKKKAFIVTDNFLYANGYTKPIETALEKQGIMFTTFSNVAPDPTLACAKEGAKLMASFKPDVVIAIGGGSAMDAGKIMWVLYEHPECDFQDMAMRFMDIRKRVYTFPKMGEKAYFIAIPTSAGTGSEVTPFAVITDEKTGVKYPLADYELMPKMAIVDADVQMMAPPGLTSASGIDAVSHALEAYASMMATSYTDGLAIQALKDIFEYLPQCYDAAVAKTANPKAREKMANAATMAGMAFANAFLGVMHSMAHKLGAFHHIPHGIANALMMEEVLRFNADPVPRKMGTFPQYDHPHTLERYLEIADALGVTGKSKGEKFMNFLQKIRDLQKRIGIKPTIRDYVPDEKDFLARLDAMTEQAFDDQCTGANPRYPLMKEIKQMYLNAYYGKHEIV